jgi:ubiquinone/menaquinone biosynthesis C-methylase UbiE
MAAEFKLRDLLHPRKDILAEIGIMPGDHVLDFGCGPGSYIRDAARLVGPTGKIYALDLHPIAIRKVESMISKYNLENVIPIRSNCKTGLKNNSVDVILLYDVFHHFDDPNKILRELHRVLKKNGLLSFSDHHMEEKDIIDNSTLNKYFKLKNKGLKTYTFTKK